jgi:hypothetical protein
MLITTTATKSSIKPALRPYIGLSLNDAEKFIADPNLMRGYRAVWKWAFLKMGGRVAMEHDAFWDRYGKVAYYARINKVRAACGFSLIVI